MLLRTFIKLSVNPDIANEKPKNRRSQLPDRVRRMCEHLERRIEESGGDVRLILETGKNRGLDWIASASVSMDMPA
jgi:hypothetical protein